MAKKKKVVEEAKKALAKKTKEPQYHVQSMIGSLQDQVDYLFKANDKLNQRIDGIITAHTKCKSLKGL